MRSLMTACTSLWLFIGFAAGNSDGFDGSIEVKPTSAKIMKIHLEHFVGSEIKFASRSTFVLQQRNINSPVESGVETSVLENELPNNGIYGPDTERFKCELQKSGFKEEITLHLDKNDGIISVDYTSPVTALPRPCDPSKISDSITFQTKLKVADRLFVQSIPLNVAAQAHGNSPTVVQQVQDDDEIATGKGKDQKSPPRQSLLVQYWYIVLPLTIMFFFGNGPEDKKAAPGNAGTAASTKTASSTRQK